MLIPIIDLDAVGELTRPCKVLLVVETSTVDPAAASAAVMFMPVGSTSDFMIQDKFAMPFALVLIAPIIAIIAPRMMTRFSHLG